MLRHVVMMRWTPTTTPEHIAAVQVGLGALPAAIPEIREYRFGPDAGLNEGNYDFVVVADFETAADYVAYRDHPQHRTVITERIADHVAARASVQYQIV